MVTRDQIPHDILSLHRLTLNLVSAFFRFIVLNALTEDSPVVLMNYYTPNEEKDQLKVLEDLNHILDNINVSEDRLCIGGDFNLNFDVRLDADGGSPKLK